jgi:hypothetical protein
MVSVFEMSRGHLEKLLSLPIADSPGVNVNESDREEAESFAGNFVAPGKEGLFFEVPISENEGSRQVSPARKYRWLSEAYFTCAGGARLRKPPNRSDTVSRLETSRTHLRNKLLIDLSSFREPKLL